MKSFLIKAMQVVVIANRKLWTQDSGMEVHCDYFMVLPNELKLLCYDLESFHLSVCVCVCMLSHV